jgi:hypothetical protein
MDTSGRAYPGVPVGQPQTGNQCIVAKLTSRDGTDTRKYAWTQQRVTSADIEDMPEGLTGTTTDRSAYDASDSDSDLTDSIVTLVRQPVRQADDSIKMEWIIAAGSGGGETIGADQGTIHQMGAANQDTWDYAYFSALV